MKKVIHFDNTADRLAFIRGEHTEIKPVEVKPKKKEKKKDEVQAD